MKSKQQTLLCHGHSRVEAEYQCEKCLKPLCSQCVNQDAHLFFCRYCGGYAQRLVIIRDEPIPIKETLVTLSGIFKNLLVGITNHMVLPAAIIIMVGAFLFYLLELRSVFLGGTEALKQIGFCFAAATVLIARYGKVHAEQERQKLYTGLLAAAALIAMMRFSTGGINLAVNLLIILAVWRFATSVTNNLNIEEESKSQENRLYGVERLQHEEIERKFGLKGAENPNLKKFLEPGSGAFALKGSHTGKRRGIFGGGSDAHGNPAKAVARLAAAAMVVFALGEPFLLSGPPEVGLRALVTVIIFLLATGVVLAAGSALGTYRHTIKAGGEATLGMVPGRTALAFFLLVMILATALTMPGIKYKGSGILRPESPGKVSDKGKGQEESRQQKPKDTEDDELKKELEDVEKEEHSQRSSRGRSGGGSPMQSLFSILAGLGKLLIIPLMVIIIGIIVFAVARLWPVLRGLRPGIRDWLRRLLEKLKAAFTFRKGQSKAGGPVRKDPYAYLERIPAQAPREAILTAYQCLLAFFELEGYQRANRHTPYEFLSSLPEQLMYLAGPARRLTEVYVGTAYSLKSPTSADSKEAYAALVDMRHLIEARRSATAAY